MTSRQIRVRQTQIVRRLIERFDLEPDIAAALLLLAPYILPVTQVDELLREPKAEAATKDLRPAAAYVTFLTCGDLKRWSLRACKVPSTTGNTKVALIVREGEEVRAFTDNMTAGGVVELYGIKIERGGSIGLFSTGDAADANKALTVFYEEEDAF